MEKILIVDDERSILELLEVALKKEGWKVTTCLSGEKALKLVDREDFDLIISDIKMPGLSGMKLLEHLRERKPDIPVIMITAYGSIKQAVEALKAGAHDYVVKPFDLDELKIVISHGLEQRKLKQENFFLKNELRKKYSFENMLGKSKKMVEIFKLIEKIARTDSTVLITGESGTGKEIAAKSIHYLSHRRNKRFVSINCGAMPENLLESELFGHARGSFTGAVADKEGLFETAQGGTLFLDEIGETSALMQVKLLRALQDRRIRPVGSNEEIAVDVRIIAATNQDLKEKIKEGKFREDFYYRLNIISFEMPPLRERKEDLPLFVSHFLNKFNGQMGKKVLNVSPEVMKVFETYSWPGNVRELENVIERAVAITDSGVIGLESLPEDVLASAGNGRDMNIKPGFNLTKYLDELSQQYIKRAHREAGGNLKKTADFLGISYRSLRYLIDKYGLKTGLRG
ncbi:MAG: sigma-54-dependent transcriptional regulator [Candidatus Aminicenantales bacterium]